MWRANLDAPSDLNADAAVKADVASAITTLRQQWHRLYQRLTLTDVDPDEAAPLPHPDARRESTGAAQWQTLKRLERELLHRQAQRATPDVSAAPVLAAVQAALPQHVWLLDFYCTDTAVNAFVVRPDGLRVQRDMAPRAAVLRAVNRWRFNVESVRLGLLAGRPVIDLAEEAHALLQQLYTWLLAPLDLPAGVALWVLPDAILWAAPFAALYDSARYAIERWPVTYLPGLPEGRGKWRAGAALPPTPLGSVNL